MPLPNYGVAIGTYSNFTKENPNNYGQWYHGFITLNTGQTTYECAVDVNSPTGEFEYMILHNLDKSMFTNISSLSNGYHELVRDAASGAIDYVRSPFVNQAEGCLGAFLNVFNRFFGTNEKVWIKNEGDEALNKLRDLLVPSVRIYAFGAPYTDGTNGVHDVHMNQGDPPGPHYDKNGIWQDGCVIVEKAGETKLSGYFGKFVMQTFNTDNNGNPI